MRSAEIPYRAPPPEPGDSSWRYRLTANLPVFISGAELVSSRSGVRDPKRLSMQRSSIERVSHVLSAREADPSGAFTLRLPLDREVGARLHQSLPFLEMFAHERFIGCRRGDRAVVMRLDPVGHAEYRSRRPIVSIAIKPRWICSKLAMSVDFAEIRQSLLGAHA